MKILSNLVEYKACTKCEVKVIRSHKKYCRRCQTLINQNLKFFEYKPKSKQKTNKPIDNIWIISPKVAKPYKTIKLDAKEFNILTKLKSIPFENLSHFSSFIVNSNQVCFTQTIITLSWELESVPEVQWLMAGNEATVAYPTPLQSDTPPPSPIARSLQLLMKQSFWDELIVNYLAKIHRAIPKFSLRNFDPKTISPALLSAIYYVGYYCRLEKTDELTEYMEEMAKSNLKKIRFKSSLSNVQALVIYTYAFRMQCKLKQARLYQSHIMRMAHNIGSQIESNIFNEFEAYDRKATYMILAFINHNMNGPLKLYSDDILELPSYEERFYDPKWQTLPKQSIKYEDNEKLKRELTAKYTVIVQKFSHQILYSISYCRLITSKSTSMDGSFCSNLSVLEKEYFECLNDIMDLKAQYSKYSEEIEDIIILVKLLYYDISIAILDNIKIRQSPIQKETIFKLYEVCNQLYHQVMNLPKPNEMYHYFLHLIGLTYLNCFNYLNIRDKLATKVKLNKILDSIEPLDPINNLIYLVFKIGLKSII
ncbi:hypothetical protein CONCODRAFT_7321 [Conidiobolus coronatus NRRL 28638]|uniref:Transcription factor domain-containing protein n=1 Tax=Conidiobolus coronatus (strain ATCC 28846 / CBS 209.66 / NRRL 28638) TaxID=796925 RepID=A0A137P598_CONC2|nr:hypothetical protein CONCODRAFT_7321 [Conidiobolus coronatus NRRL 28638]|eukprot:KXN70177.1 hypothetical protein CONCODRAFT_7321 [Conidiobolus coronatus NRRL 28638]